MRFGIPALVAECVWLRREVSLVAECLRQRRSRPGSLCPHCCLPPGPGISAQGKESELALPSRNFLEHVMERYSRILEPKDWGSGQGPQSGSSAASKPGWASWARGLLIRMQISQALRQNPCVGGRGGQPAAHSKGSSGASDEFYRPGRPGPAHTASHHRLGPELWLTLRTAGLSPLCHQARRCQG